MAPDIAWWIVRKAIFDSQSEELGMRHRQTNHWSDDDSEETIEVGTSDGIWQTRLGEPAEG